MLKKRPSAIDTVIFLNFFASSPSPPAYANVIVFCFSQSAFRAPRATDGPPGAATPHPPDRTAACHTPLGRVRGVLKRVSRLSTPNCLWCDTHDNPA